nr:hypothetical protein B0A51_06453 [Rachicladosporium sp. CCFEE 5018]OQO24723.1 hypothetical protein B0A51_05923 [Rachicladosporium sp. CCFEE 5018]
MANLPAPPRTASTSSDRYRTPSYRNVSSSSTGYHGFDLEASDYQSLQQPSSPVLAARPALTSRLLSSITTSQPAASALTRSGSLLHSRAKSIAAYVPRLNSSSNPASAEPTQHSTNRLFGDLFNGESAPVRLGVAASSPTKEKEETEFIMEYRPSFTERPSPRSRQTSMIHQTPQSTSKTSWFSRRVTTSPIVPVSTPATEPDDLVTLNVHTALFPHGRSDDLNPHAFNDLLLNATSLLERMQTAYKVEVDLVASVQPELEARREEVEEAETRSRHLKLQLEHMARRAQEQEQAMRELADQLTAEKMKVHELRSPSRSRSKNLPETPCEPRRRARTSGTTSTASDSGFESDAEESVFSHEGSRGGNATPWSPASSAGTYFREGDEISAWATVEQLRRENRGLKGRVGEMESTLETCIELVGGIRL